MRISNLRAREILDSRGFPTIEATIQLENGIVASAGVPSGASTGTTEVLEMRDNDPTRYFGKGVLKAVENVNQTIARKVVGMEFDSQQEFDRLLIEIDGTALKSNLGGNSILSVSTAYSKAMALTYNQPLYEYFGRIYWEEAYTSLKLQLPTPMILVMEGGKHGNWATDIQEYMIIPNREKYPQMSEMVRMGAEVFKATHDILVKKGYSGTVGFEGAFAPNQIRSNAEAFQIIMEGVSAAGYKVEEDLTFAMDIAASEFYDHELQRYVLRREERELTAREWIELQKEWIRQYPIVSIEDPLHEEDWENWSTYTDELGSTLQVVGDDLLTTNVERISRASKTDAVNAVLIKPNQIGTISETMDAIRMSSQLGYKSIISHRGGETNDSLIADLAVGTDAYQCKFGGPNRGERVAKYNRLMEIEREIG